MKIEIGNYLTRSGMEVEVYEIKDTKATCCVHGYLNLTKKKAGKDRVRPKKEWNIWTAEGAYQFVGEHQLDLVERIDD